jgi:hypothetical protein
MQIFDIFHNCPELEQQQSDPKDLGSKFPRSKRRKIPGYLPVDTIVPSIQ